MADSQCQAVAQSFQGEDTIQCELTEGHSGWHQVFGLFPITWEEDEAQPAAPEA